MAKSSGIRGLLLGALVAMALAPASASALPTHVELERATDRFLARHADPVHARAGSGGVGTRSERVLPENRLVSMYGAPQMGKTLLGRLSPERAAAAIGARSAPYEALGSRPVVPGFDLVAVFATAARGPENLYRSRQDADIIQIYLEQVRAVGGRLMLDIQPGRARIMDEMRALEPWIAQPDVDVAIDAEWNVGRRGIPNQTEGKVTAAQLNAASKWLSTVVRDNALPPKLLLVHQFKPTSVRGERKVRRRDGVQTVLNFDGSGGQGPKIAGYEDLAAPRLFTGFTIFDLLDTPPMKPRAVLGLDPEPDVVIFQ